MKDKTRLIALSDSPEMDGELVIFETNAPSKRLKELEKESCALFTEEAYDEIPNWSYTLEFEGYLCRYIDSEQHVTPYGTSCISLEINSFNTFLNSIMAAILFATIPVSGIF